MSTSWPAPFRRGVRAPSEAEVCEVTHDHGPSSQQIRRPAPEEPSSSS
jgi:hypothetical protein